MEALHHHTAVIGKPCENGPCGIAVELIARIDIGHMFRADREGRDFQIAVDLENITCGDDPIGRAKHMGRHRVLFGSDNRFGRIDGGEIAHGFNPSFTLL